ncbi:hypothetical protein BD779DRAFT_1484508 [Infundibulicybe gibba]|nr:hypothetical protein BD779DRAFT_1484508 [Infundibulicybe gibba]
MPKKRKEYDPIPFNPPKYITSFWKYNFIYHMNIYHCDEADNLPDFPYELRVSRHISRLEESKMGVAEEKTQGW